MKEYKDETKKWIIRNLLHTRKPVAFKVVEQLEADGMIEDYDTFEVLSDVAKNPQLFYLDREFYVLDAEQKDFRQIDRKALQGRYLKLQKCITNNAQGFIQRYGVKAFNELSTAEFVEEMLGNYIENER